MSVTPDVLQESEPGLTTTAERQAVVDRAGHAPGHEWVIVTRNLQRHYDTIFGPAFRERAALMPQAVSGGRVMLRRPGYPVDHAAIIEACAATGTARLTRRDSLARSLRGREAAAAPEHEQ